MERFSSGDGKSGSGSRERNYDQENCIYSVQYTKWHPWINDQELIIAIRP
jgi:hypothetical protein